MLNNNIGVNYVVSTFKVNNDTNIAMKKHISITFEHSGNIQNIIKNECWGDSNKKLYYHIDYTFRARYCDNKIKLYRFKNNSVFGLFCLNLYRKYDINNKSPLYLVFKPNTDESKYQKWSVGNDCDKTNQYCMTKQEIMNKYRVKSNDIPVFTGYKYNKINHDDMTNFNWNDIFKKVLNRKYGGNTKDILYSCFNANGILLDPCRMRQQLSKPFKQAYNMAIKKDRQSPGYIVPALFFNRKRYKIVFQVMLEIKYPYNGNKTTKFVVVISENYQFIRLISVEMARKNTRLIGELPDVWKHKEKELDNTDNESTKSNTVYESKSDVDVVNITPASSVSNNNIKIQDMYNITPSSSPNWSTPNNNNIGKVFDTLGLTPNSSISSIDITSTPNTSVSNVNIYNKPTVIYPKFIKMEMDRHISLVNGSVIESITSIKKDVTNILYPSKETNQYAKCYNISELDQDIVLNLLMHNQLFIKSYHEICIMNSSEEIETVSRSIMNNKGNIIFTTMKSYINKTTPKGVQKSEITLNTNINNNNININTANSNITI